MLIPIGQEKDNIVKQFLKTVKLEKIFFLFIFLLGWIIYSNTFNSSFHFDDQIFIVNNPSIRTLFPSKILDILAFGEKNRFIAFRTFALNYHFHKLDVFGYHMINFMIHLITSVLVWWFVRLLLSTFRCEKLRPYASTIAIFTALLFVAHPVQTGAVTYITQRFASLVALFYLLCVCLYVKGRCSETRLIASLHFCGAIVAGMLAMFTKENAFTLPFAILMIEFCLLRQKIHTKKVNMKLCGVFVLCALLFVLILQSLFPFDWWYHILFNSKGLSESHDNEIITNWTYFFTQFRVIVAYLKLLFFPIGQNFDYDIAASHSFFEWPVLGCFFILLGIIIYALKIFQRYPLVSVGIFWFFITLSLESSIFRIDNLMYEHRLYLPSVGFFLAFCVGCHRLIGNYKIRIVFLSLIVGVFSLLTYQRNKVWENDMTLWQDVVKKSPHKSRAHMSLGEAYMRQGDDMQAVTHFNKAIELHPNDDASYNNLGLIDLKNKQYDEALSNFKKALSINPDLVFVNNNVGVCYLMKGDLDKAEQAFLRAIEEEFGYRKPYYYLANIYVSQGKKQKAIEMYKKVIRNYPDDTESLFALVNLYFDEKYSTEALQIGHLILKNVNDVSILTNTGSIFAQNQQHSMAYELYTKALKKDSGYKSVYLELGKLLGNRGRFSEAISVWEKGLRITPGDKVLQDHIRQGKALLENSLTSPVSP